MCLIETYSRVQGGKHLSHTFHIKNYWKRGDALPPLFFNFALECHYDGLDERGGLEIKWYPSVSSLS